ncbi:MAG: histidine kinase [Dehalococcoidia bacterium]
MRETRPRQGRTRALQREGSGLSREAGMSATERAALARSLHDGLTQEIWYAALLVDAVQSDLSANRLDQAAERLEQLRSVIAGQYLSAREVLGSLSAAPASREADEDLDQFVRRVREVSGPAIELALDRPLMRRLPRPIVDGLTAIARELIINAIKHSGAASIQVAIAGDDRSVSLVVGDNGRGFGYLSDGGAESGLRSVAARVDQLGASIVIDSAEDTGTTITVQAPLDRPTSLTSSQAGLLR